jgi:hypothetical protein
VYETARAVIPDARVAYVDHDLMVCSHVGAFLATDEGVQAAQADLTDPAAVLGHQPSGLSSTRPNPCASSSARR